MQKLRTLFKRKAPDPVLPTAAATSSKKVTALKVAAGAGGLGLGLAAGAGAAYVADEAGSALLSTLSSKSSWFVGLAVVIVVVLVIVYIAKKKKER